MFFWFSIALASMSLMNKTASEPTSINIDNDTGLAMTLCMIVIIVGTAISFTTDWITVRTKLFPWYKRGNNNSEKT